MSGSLTVIGGHSGNVLTGLVTIPAAQTSGEVSALQSQLTALSDLVTASGGAAQDINNQNIIGIGSGTYAPTSIPTILELTNTDSTGATTSGSASFTGSVPTGYDALVVQAPGSETITGNGSTNFLAVFGSQSAVTFTSNGGNGTIAASSNDFINVSGTYGAGIGWSVIGATTGNDTINTNAGYAAITTAGAANVVGLGGASASVVAGGGNDLVASYSGNDTISVTGGANVLVTGGADTVYAAAGSTSVKAFFFGHGGGILDFINNSTTAASVTGGADGASGSVTVFGGAGGGYYQGGSSGNNSLVGGTGAATLIGGGDNNFLSVTGGTGNALFAGDGTATLIGGVGSADDLFQGGGGTDVISSSGAGQSSFFVGNAGSETLTGSTVSGATNSYYFVQDSATGGGTDVITNFKYNNGSTVSGAEDNVYINPFSGDASGVVVSGIETTTINGSASSLVQLSDTTEIRLIGVTFTAAQTATIIGSSSF